MIEDAREPSARKFTAAVLKTVREVHQHGTKWHLPSFVAAAAALCVTYGEDGKQRSPRFRVPERAG
jgi:hypothetical protein